MIGHDMRELRIGERILDRRSVCNLRGGKRVCLQARTELPFTFCGASCGDMGYTMINARHPRPETDGLNVAPCSKGGLC